MPLVNYERIALARIYFGNVDVCPGAAWFSVCEVLSKRGLVKEGKVTKKGRKLLVVT